MINVVYSEIEIRVFPFFLLQTNIQLNVYVGANVSYFFFLFDDDNDDSSFSFMVVYILHIRSL